MAKLVVPKNQRIKSRTKTTRKAINRKDFFAIIKRKVGGPYLGVVLDAVYADQLDGKCNLTCGRSV